MVSEEQIITYVTRHPGCKLADIAVGLGVSSAEIIHGSEGCPSIYQIHGINCRHYLVGMEKEQGTSDLVDQHKADLAAIIEDHQHELECRDEQHLVEIADIMERHQDQVDALETHLTLLEQQAFEQEKTWIELEADLECKTLYYILAGLFLLCLAVIFRDGFENVFTLKILRHEIDLLDFDNVLTSVPGTTC